MIAPAKVASFKYPLFDMQNETATLGNRTTSCRVQLYGSLTIRACHQTVIAMLEILTVDCVAIGAGKIQGLAQPCSAVRLLALREALESPKPRSNGFRHTAQRSNRPISLMSSRI